VNDSYGVLASARGLFAIKQHIGREEFESFVKLQRNARSFPGSGGVGFAQRVDHDRIAEFESQIRADGEPDFHVWGVDGADQTLHTRYVLRFAEPANEFRRSLGFDIGSEPRRREAIETAIRTGEPAISQRVNLLVGDPNERAGYLYLLPVYRGGVTPEREDERAEMLEGLICAPVFLDAVRSHLRTLADGLLDLEVFDGQAPDASTLMIHTDDDALTAGAIDTRHHFTRRFMIQMPARAWIAVVHSTPVFDSSVNTWLAPFTGIAGSVVSILIGVSFWMIGSARSRAEAIARAMNVDLQAAYDRAERNLHNVLAFRTAIDTSAIVSETDSRGRILDVNDEF